ncbi:hypothetical protein A8924_1004 [Saccharopolyspora erythraea NRRL 2338]|uniref:Uncharacterized protein n=1 Tax=Saccharopolyspora erythraea (strain ATCC 11635 / DSM 40517 / JCM 4748 / NBRC 13426 / NCIMB 8594 / NRRL 2338) TaxID=405948 RepID=A4F7C6_SACEN|nr:hypothetical protein [Saccharopolyspora erythraea]PFG93752.1 hypothetical protein A8924_1004 [Saccharopolyspora erythraea NRRL 2338]QRK90589.1 hypothetical protein JQX30_03570 [Saccharopolyspora erythraea]CAL99950.1 hypothetical protein SACE_0605 [Saccharopolyspora erythraea NRRL 2338]
MPTRSDAVVVGTTAPVRSADARVVGGCESTAAAVTATLGAAIATLPDEAGTSVPVLVLADAYSRWAARRFARRCADPARRLRPSDSTGLETSELLRKFAIASGWRGPCYLLAGSDAAEFLETGRAFAATGPVVLCEVAPLDTDALDDPGCTVTAVVLTGADSVLDIPQAPPGALLAAAGSAGGRG